MNESTPRDSSGSPIPEVPNRAPGAGSASNDQSLSADRSQATESIPTAGQSASGNPTSPIPTQAPNSSQYGQPQYGQPQSAQTQYGQPQSAQTQYGQPQSAQTQYGQTRYGQNYSQDDRPKYGEYGAQQPYGTQPDNSNAAFVREEQPLVDSKDSKARRFTGKSLVGGMVLAGLLGGLVGGGAVVGANALSGNSLLSPAASQVSSTGGNEAVVINNPENVTAVSAAAAKASPSVVTIDVAGGSSGGSGSGVILDKEGHILTNTHVVTLGGEVSDPQVSVQLSNGKVYEAKVVGTDPLSDLAVVKIDAPDLTPISIGKSSELNVGDTAVAIGAPLGLSGTVTDGIVSTINRTISVQSSAVPETTDSSSQDNNGNSQDNGNGDQFNFNIPGVPQQQTQSQGSIYLNVIQTDAAINHGNSGGALVDVNGNLIGINVAIASSSGSSSTSSDSGSIGVGFAIPVDYAKRVADDIIANGSATHALMGVSVQAKSSDVNESNNSFSVGAEVKEVTSGSAAEKAGLKTGDVIVGVGDRVVSDSQSLTAAVREYAKGDSADVKFTRNGQEQTVKVTFEQTTEAN
ncbi:S1C family serine protease [Neomicrococcus lactis]